LNKRDKMDQIAPTLENILKESAAAADEAQRLAEVCRLAELCPIYSSALNQFAEGIRQAQEELSRRTRPEVSETSDAR
jgi:dsDNA-binding SOS-regulon protein